MNISWHASLQKLFSGWAFKANYLSVIATANGRIQRFPENRGRSIFFIVSLMAFFATAYYSNIAFATDSEVLLSSNQAPSVPGYIEIKVTNISPLTNRLGDEISVSVSDLPALLSLARQEQKDVILFVNGEAMSDITSDGMDLGSDTLSFQLKRTILNKDRWAPLLRNPVQNNIRRLPISVGIQGQSPLLLASSVRVPHLWVIGWKWWTIAWVLVSLALTIGFVLLAVYSDILRGPTADQNGRYPFSLSRSQAAFWLFVTSFSFVFIWVVTGDVTTLNGSVLTLLGISIGTYLAASFLEKSPSNAQSAAPTPVAPAAPVVPALGTPGNGKIANLVNSSVTKFQRIRFVGYFLGDILTDDTGGVSIHRFQNFLWTIILGIIFIVSVVNELSMPEFNSTLLALMGISSAAYIGSKLNQ